jgi:hypothetical protein
MYEGECIREYKTHYFAISAKLLHHIVLQNKLFVQPGNNCNETSVDTSRTRSIAEGRCLGDCKDCRAQNCVSFHINYTSINCQFSTLLISEPISRSVFTQRQIVDACDD